MEENSKLTFLVLFIFVITFVQGCEHNGQTYKQGDLRWEECNSCSCTESNDWLCTLEGCSTGVCYDEGNEYQDGEGLWKECNRCTCSATDEDKVGSIGCTEKGCPDNVCWLNGQAFGIDSVRYEDCNSCTCGTDGWRCTEIGCATGVCYYEGNVIKAGQAFNDGCNDCICSVTDESKVGVLGCTLKLCLTKTRCLEERDQFKSSSLGIPPPGAFVPKCQPDGSYEELQCHGSIGQCWCVDPKTGKELLGTRSKRGEEQPRCRRNCVRPCKRIHQPVCGSDGVTYPNECEFKNAKCSDSSLTIKNYFMCQDDIKPVETLTLKIEGKVKLPKNFDGNLPAGSCLNLRIQEEIFCETLPCDNPFLASKQIKDPAVSNGIIGYKMELSNPTKPSYLVEVTLNNGWCREENGDEWIRVGDYTNDEAATFSPTDKKKGGEIDVDVKLIHYVVKPVPESKNEMFGSTEKGCSKRLRQISEPECLVACPAILAPQCGSDGKTYDNKCLLEATRDCNKPELKFVHPGKCEDCPRGTPIVNCVKDPCAHQYCKENKNAVCKPNYCGQCKAEFYENGKKIECKNTKCYQGCPFNYEPVCGSDGKTYSNRCTFEVAQCEDEENKLYLQKEGSCEDESSSKLVDVKGRILLPPTIGPELPPDSCLRVSVTEEILCDYIEGGSCNPPVLGDVKLDRPTIDSDGTIAFNLQMKRSSMDNLIIDATINMGWCSNGDEGIKNGDYFMDTQQSMTSPNDDVTEVIQDLTLRRYNSKPTEEKKLSDDECPEDVPIVACTYEPCAQLQCVDNVKAICKANYCGGCNAQWFLDGKQIECPKTACITGCPYNYEPVCGSDGKTYSNRCTFEVAQCEDEEKTLSLQKEGKCVEESSSQLVNVKGRIILPPTIGPELPPDSCLRVSVTEEILCDYIEGGSCNIPVLGDVKLDSPTIDSDGTIAFNLQMKRSSMDNLIIDATINMGWCSNGDESIKNGDYFMDTQQSMTSPNDDVTEVIQDLTLRRYNSKPTEEKKLSDDECPEDVPIVACTYDPCAQLRCVDNDNAICKANYCGGCNAQWFLDGKPFGCRSTKCFQGCPYNYEPMCGSDGKTYSNRCTFEVAQCEDEEKTLSLSYEGECNHDENHVTLTGRVLVPPPITTLPPGSCMNLMLQEEIVCSAGGDSEEGEAEENCEVPVLGSAQIQNPTLNSDGSIPYTLQFTNRKQSRFTVQASINVGWCRDEDSDDSVRSGDYLNTYSVDFDAPPEGTKTMSKDISVSKYETTPQEKPTQEKPLFLEVTCPEGSWITSCTFMPCARLECESNSDAVCKNNFCGKCVAEWFVNDKKVTCEKTRCSQICTREYDPHCGQDGKTYGNRCEFEVAQCQDNTLVLAQRGECKKVPKCNDHRTRELARSDDGIVGNFVPECTTEGHYKQKQCHSSTGYCYCVNKVSGEKIVGTEKRSWEGEVKCGKKVKVYGDIIVPKTSENTFPAGSCLTVRIQEQIQCEEGLECNVPVLGSIKINNPQMMYGNKILYNMNFFAKENTNYEVSSSIHVGHCTDETRVGDFLNDQAFEFATPFGDEVKVDIKLIQVEGETTTTTTEEVTCPEGSPIVGCTFMPCAHLECESNSDAVCKNNFCGKCVAEWFVNDKKVTCEKARCSQICTREYDPHCGQDGKTYGNRCEFEVAQCQDNTLVLAQRGECKKDPTRCRAERDQWKTSPQGIAPPGAFVPSCTDDGYYEALQCHGSVGQCWCVEKDSGKELLGTRTSQRYGQEKPNCGGNEDTEKTITVSGEVHFPDTTTALKTPSCLRVIIREEILCEEGLDCDVPILASQNIDNPTLKSGSVEYSIKMKVNADTPYMIAASLNHASCDVALDNKVGDFINELGYRFETPKSGNTVTEDLKVIEIKASGDSATISGDISFPSSVRSLKKPSCLTVSVREEILCDETVGGCDVPILGSQEIENPVLQRGVLPYTVDLLVNVDTRYTIDVLLRHGYCTGDAESDVGDFINDVSYSVEAKEDVEKYTQDIKVIEIKKPVEKTITVSGEVHFPDTTTALKTPSCLRVIIREEILCEEGLDCDVPILASQNIDNPTLKSGSVEYSIKMKVNADTPYMIAASLNHAACDVAHDNKVGDFINELGYQFETPKSGNTVTEDLKVIEIKASGDDDDECPRGVPIVTCTSDPCTKLYCADDREAVCKANFCGGCNAEFFKNGKKIECANKKCVKACPLIYKPVCGSDDKTYSNLCVLQSTQCTQTEKTLRMKHEGPCKKDTTTTTTDVKPEKFTQVYGYLYLPPTVPTSFPENSCLRMSVIEAIYCDEHGDLPCVPPPKLVDYKSTSMRIKKILRGFVLKYKMTMKESKASRYIVQAHIYNGWCPSGDDESMRFGDYFTDTNHEFGTGVELYQRIDIDLMEYKDPKDKSDKCLRGCTFEYEPVCGSDGQTYDNLCLFKIGKCKNNNLKKVSDGQCGECPPGVPIARCALNPCDTATCPAYPNAVCKANYCGGCNAEFYQENKRVICSDVRVLPEETGRKATTFDAKSKTPTTSCLSMKCKNVFEPICGSDRKTHASFCHMNLEACTTSTTIFKMHDGVCSHCSELCTREYKPRCGTDGKTYGNECELNKKICETNGRVGFAYDGECASPTCRKFCTADYRPVCGSDGKTYGNMCNLQSKACSSNGKITFAYEGQCKKCSAICTREFDPYCGTDGRTYSNKCMMNYGVCKSGGRVQMKYRGACDSPLCPRRCPQRRSHVCGSDDKTYPSACSLQQTTCQTKGKIYLKHFGRCAKSCARFNACPFNYDPVCGTDRKTYSNMCLMRATTCKTNSAVRLAHRGQCGNECPRGQSFVSCDGRDPCETSYCARFPRAQCRQTNCGSCKAAWFIGSKKIKNCGTKCNEACTREYFPQCGSDGKTYGNPCTLNVAKCQSKGRLQLAYPGECNKHHF